MARRTDDIEKETSRKVLSMTQDEKRKMQRKRLMEEGLRKRKRATKREKFYGNK